MFSRQRAILRLIEVEGGTISRLRLVKLAFMLSREAGVPRAGVYDFVPYKRGPFSFTLYHEIRALEREGWLAEAEHDIRIAEVPNLETAFLDLEFLKMIDSVSDRYRTLPTSAVVDSVYASHPWFTLNSEMANKRAASRPAAEPAVYTVGYEGIMVDALLDLLLRKGIRRLVDVRCNPVARRYGYHKATLCRLASPSSFWSVITVCRISPPSRNIDSGYNGRRRGRTKGEDARIGAVATNGPMTPDSWPSVGASTACSMIRG